MKARMWIGAALLALAVGVLAGAWYFVQEYRRERESARRHLSSSNNLLLTMRLREVAGKWRHEPGDAARLLDDAEMCPEGLRDFTWHYFRRLCRRDLLDLKGPSGPAEGMALTTDGATLAAAGPDGVALWDVAARRKRGTLGASKARRLAFSRDGTLLAVAWAGEVELWTVSGGKQRSLFRWPADGVGALAFAPDGKALAAARRDEVKRWDTATGRGLPALKVRAGLIASLAFSPDGKALAAGFGEDVGTGMSWGEVAVWDLDTGRPRAGFEKAGVTVSARSEGAFRDQPTPATAVAFSPDGKRLAIGGRDYRGPVRLLDAATGRTQQTLYCVARRAYPVQALALAFSADGKGLACETDSSVVVLNLEAGQPRLTLWPERPGD